MTQKRTIPVVTILLVIANVFVFFYTEMGGSTNDTEYMISMGAAYEPIIAQGHEYYRLVTHFFLHFGFEHLFNNMVSLAVLGSAVEPKIGHIRFALLYMFSGILAGVGSVLYHVKILGDVTVSAGASGAIYGLTGALLVIILKRKNSTKNSMVVRYLLFIAISLYSGFSDSSIDNAAHICGFIVGVLFCAVMTIGGDMEVDYED